MARSVVGMFSGAVAAAALMTAPLAQAGPPFVTDDPAPTDRSRWEIYNFASGVRADGATGGQAGIDLNYGAAKDLQLTAVIPLGYDTGAGRVGLSNVELAAKYRFLHQQAGSLVPDLAVFPRVFTPTGGTRLGTGHVQLLLPIWAGKDFGPWSVFGGGGYTINPGRGERVVQATSSRLASASRFGPETGQPTPPRRRSSPIRRSDAPRQTYETPTDWLRQRGQWPPWCFRHR